MALRRLIRKFKAKIPPYPESPESCVVNGRTLSTIGMQKIKKTKKNE